MSFKIKLLFTLPLILCTLMVSGQGIVGEDMINNGLISGMDGSFTNGAFVNQIGNRNTAEIYQKQRGRVTGGEERPEIQQLSQVSDLGQLGFSSEDGLLLLPSLTLSPNLAAINQIGNQNSTHLSQDGQGLVSLTNQIGRNNTAYLISEGQNIISISNQKGIKNSLELNSQGKNIIALSNQIGINNSIESSVSGRTFLGANITLYNQIGRDNSIDVMVNSGVGIGLQTVIVNQTGDGNSLTSTIEGNRNHVRVNQTGGMVVNLSGILP